MTNQGMLGFLRAYPGWALNSLPQKHRQKRKRKGEEKKSDINIVYILFNITGGGLLALFDDELTTF